MTLYSWNRRYKWSLGTKSVVVQKVAKACKVNSAKVIEGILAKRGRTSKDALSLYAVRAAKGAARAARHIPTRTHQDVKNIEDVRKSLWPDPQRIEQVSVSVTGVLTEEKRDYLIHELRLM